MKRPTFAGVLLVGGLLLVGGCGTEKSENGEEVYSAETPEVTHSEPAPATAVATLQGREGNGVSGTVTFTESAGSVTVYATVLGVSPPGEHGFHVHAAGDCSAPDFTSAGGHFNPGDVPHGGPDSPERHSGDLGNILIGEDGSGSLSLTTDLLTVSEGPNSVVGKGVILHEGRDDLESQPTGAAGARLACGVVAIQG